MTLLYSITRIFRVVHFGPTFPKALKQFILEDGGELVQHDKLMVLYDFIDVIGSSSQDT